MTIWKMNFRERKRRLQIEKEKLKFILRIVITC